MPRTQTTHQNDIADLIDIDSVQVDIDLPVEERIKQYVAQVKNPYRFRAGGLIVNIEHLNNGLTLESAFSSYLNDLM